MPEKWLPDASPMPFWGSSWGGFNAGEETEIASRFSNADSLRLLVSFSLWVESQQTSATLRSSVRESDGRYETTAGQRALWHFSLHNEFRTTAFLSRREDRPGDGRHKRHWTVHGNSISRSWSRCDAGTGKYTLLLPGVAIRPGLTTCSATSPVNQPNKPLRSWAANLRSTPQTYPPTTQ